MLAQVEQDPDPFLGRRKAELLQPGDLAEKRGLERQVRECGTAPERHGDFAGCGGHLGYAESGRVDVCTTLVNAMTRRTLLHEMGHIWLDVNTDAAVRERFLELRGLRAWNASTDPWERRGYEQGAEVISWVIGERILGAQVSDNDPEALEDSFEILTGIAPPRATAPSP